MSDLDIMIRDYAAANELTYAEAVFELFGEE